ATVSFTERVVRVDVTRDRIRELVFARDRWPDLEDTRFTARIRAAFGASRERGDGTSERIDTRRERTTDRNVDRTRERTDTPVQPRTGQPGRPEDRTTTPARDPRDRTGQPTTRPEDRTAPPARDPRRDDLGAQPSRGDTPPPATPQRTPDDREQP